MLNLKYIVTNTEEVKQKLATRGFDTAIIDQIVVFASQRSEIMTRMQALEAKRNTISREIGQLKKQGKPSEKILFEVNAVKKQIDDIKVQVKEVNDNINQFLLTIPNLPAKNVPVGKTDSDNIVIKEYDFAKSKDINVKAHHEIAKMLNIVDFERAVKIAGTRFWAYKNLGAKLVRALENFMLDMHIKKGYIELSTPVIVKSQALIGTGQLPKFKEDLFKIEGRDSYLIPTAEVPLTNWYANEIIEVPQAFTAFTNCFRSEAGAAGKDTRGLIRAHQFNKVELVKFTSKEKGQEEFHKTLEDAKSVLKALKLPFRELELCTGDLGFSSMRTIDLEVWLPSEKKYREISSVSIFGDFQARRAGIRYRDKNNKNKYAWTINGSGLAIDRTIAAILENYQNADGFILIPEALVPYMGVSIIK